MTARKRAESLQDVPFAISARTGEHLQAVGAQNIEDVSRNVAGLSVQNLGPGQSQVGLRGISAGKTDRDLPGVKEQVGVYMDESVISLSLFTPDLDLYDLNRVEVLRGPQGTLFGSGSLAGTVRYISNQPDLSDGYGDVEVGVNTISDGGDGGFRPRHGERAARRPRGAARRRLLQRDAGLHRRPRPGGTLDQNVNDGERQGGRMALRWELTDNIVVTPRVIYQDIDINGYNRQDVFNILGNPFTTTQPPVNIRERQQYRAARRALRRRLLPRRPDDGVRLRPGGADVDQLVHGPRHPRHARRLAAHRQRDLRHPRRVRATACASTRRCSTTRRSRCSRRNCASRRTLTAASSG